MSARGYREDDEAFNVFAALLALGGNPREDDSEHYHRCLKCSQVWHHNTKAIYANDDSREAFDRAHACPKCGQGDCVDKFETEHAAKTAPKRWRERNEE